MVSGENTYLILRMIRIKRQSGRKYCGTSFKGILYHHTVTAKLYNIIRNYRRDRFNKLSDEEFAQMMYKEHTGEGLDLKNPRTFDEKVWYLKLHERDPLQTKCTDKYEVREYVEECGLGHILNEVYGIYDSFKAVPFDQLPDRFFMKCTHTSGANAIFDRNKPFDYKYQKNEFDFWMKRNYFWGSREWNYKDIKPRIICEKYWKIRMVSFLWIINLCVLMDR